MSSTINLKLMVKDAQMCFIFILITRITRYPQAECRTEIQRC